MEVYMQVQEIMHKGVSRVQIKDSIKKVAALMKREDIGAVPVYKDQRLVGIVTDRDIVVSSVANGRTPDDAVSHVMAHEIIYVYGQDDVTKATQLMKQHQICRLLVVDEINRPVGMLSLQDLAKNISDPDQLIDLISSIKR